jgi:hypothetical protein
MNNDNCNSVGERPTLGAMKPPSLSLRDRIGEIAEILAEASNFLADAEMKLYIPKPQNDCCGEEAPCGDSLEYYIGQLGRLACVVRNRAMEVNSRI